jgi:hypothetical protein
MPSLNPGDKPEADAATFSKLALLLNKGKCHQSGSFRKLSDPSFASQQHHLYCAEFCRMNRRVFMQHGMTRHHNPSVSSACLLVCQWQASYCDKRSDSSQSISFGDHVDRITIGVFCAGLRVNLSTATYYLQSAAGDIRTAMNLYQQDNAWDRRRLG